MNGFERRAAKKKDDILKATLALMLETSEPHLLVTKIAESANVSQVTIFKFFGNKINLLKEAVLIYAQNALDRTRELVDSPLSFAEKLKLCMFVKTQTLKKLHKEAYLTYAKLAHEKNPQLFAILAEGTELMNQLFAQGKRENAVNKRISNQSLNLYLQLLGHSFYADENLDKVIPAIDELMDLIFYGFAGKAD